MPADRQPILTFVGGYDERVAIEAIRRELLREGQVFWVHNRVRSIEHAAARLRELVPEARIAVAHGQMDEGTLEQVVVDFWDGQFDVLVCTTIIESGIDMPTVNTLVVERSDLLGLGQIHGEAVDVVPLLDQRADRGRISRGCGAHQRVVGRRRQRRQQQEPAEKPDRRSHGAIVPPDGHGRREKNESNQG